MRFYIILLIYLLLVSCSSPNEERVRNEFLAENPDYTVTSIYVGEGDSSNVYYHIRYKKPTDKKLYEDVWLYQNPNWINTKRKVDSHEWKNNIISEPN